MTIQGVVRCIQDWIDDPYYPVELNVGCPDLERVHKKVWRVHAHVFHYDWTICIVEDIELLPDEHKFGIMLHEFGHLYGGETDAEADLWVEEALGVVICYRDTLQYVEDL
jgi:hypothetical protein